MPRQDKVIQLLKEQIQIDLAMIQNLLGDISSQRALHPRRIKEGLLLRKKSLEEVLAKTK